MAGPLRTPRFSEVWRGGVTCSSAPRATLAFLYYHRTRTRVFPSTLPPLLRLFFYLKHIAMQSIIAQISQDWEELAPQQQAVYQNPAGLPQVYSLLSIVFNKPLLSNTAPGLPRHHARGEWHTHPLCHSRRRPHVQLDRGAGTGSRRHSRRRACVYVCGQAYAGSSTSSARARREEPAHVNRIITLPRRHTLLLNSRIPHSPHAVLKIAPTYTRSTRRRRNSSHAGNIYL